MNNMGLIRTNERCVGCNKCIRTCSCMGAMVASENAKGSNIIEVNGDKCVACGACFDACEHNAREFVDDTEAFFADLHRGEQISILIAPAFLANYPRKYESVLGGLKQLGVNRMISVSFGADITTWGYLNYVKQYNFVGGISQPCPAVVGYIERYVPELLPKLFPVQSPMMCAAIYATKTMGITDKLAFISPCIAKKEEIMSKRGKGLISYNVTFDHLMKYVREHQITGPSCKDEIEYGLGSVYPMPGGLKENVYWFLGEDAYIRQCEGESHMYHYLEANKERLAGGNTSYLFVDALNCAQGCLYGTGTESAKNATDDVLMEMMRIKEASKNKKFRDTWSKRLTPAQRLKLLNRQFAHLDLNDYLCGYTDRSAECTHVLPTQAELDAVYRDMGKNTAESRRINCSCCGYETCELMATAIFNGFNHKENCIHYVKDQVEQEKNRAVALADEVEQEKILQAIEKIQDDTKKLSNIIIEINEKTANLAEASEEIAASNDIILEATEKVKGSLQELTELHD